MSSATDEPQDPEASAAGLEPLACVACRSRKLKCDRVKPACTRCARVSSDCAYPESRRKPTVKRRNVKELEARLEQVESLLRGANGPRPSDEVNNGSNETSPDSSNALLEETINENGARARTGNDIPSPAYRMEVPFQDPDMGNPPPPDWTRNDTQLLEQGLSESLPPWEVIEELTNSYFNTSHYYFPIIHPERYRQAMHGSLLMRPPMCLQYMVLGIAAYHHDVYSGYSDVFYRRARLYFERDEMKGDGEYFVTIQHAQALGLLATYEAKRMLFTRASMNTAKCVRLVYMMGLDKLDADGPPKRAPALSEAKSWLELEERRRTFWGAFAIDSHASASTGWPSLISEGDVTTRLPASEEAFRSGVEEASIVLDEVFEGGQYSSFAGTIVTCHVLKTIQQTLQHTKASDRPEDVLNGPYWEKHRDLDSKLTSLFIFLPGHFRLLHNPKEPAAIHLNLNLHASVICLHHHAIEQADKYSLDPSVKAASLARMRSAAMEIASISKSAAHITPVFKSPLCALSLYSATTVFVYVAKSNPTPGLNSFDRYHLELILKLMEAISQIHEITRAFLLQAWLDIERNGLTVSIRMPNLIKSGKKSNLSDFPMTPIVTRTSVAEHSEINPILPGRLPLGNAKPARVNLANQDLSSISRKDATSGRLETMANLLDAECFAAVLGAVTRNVGPQQPPVAAVPDMNPNKRKRASASPGPEAMGGGPSRARSGQNATSQNYSALCRGNLGGQGYEVHVLPDRTGSSASSSPAYRGAGTETQGSGSTHTSPSIMGLGSTWEENRVDIRHLQGRVAAPLWDGNEQFFMGEVTDEMITQALQSGCEPWGMLATDLQWTEGTGHGG